MRLPTSLMTGVLFLCAVGARSQTMNGGKIDPAWLRADASSKTADFNLVAGLTDANGWMNFNGFSQGGLVLTVPQAWNVLFHFKNEDPNLPHSVEVIAETPAVPVGPVTPAFEHATTGRLEQGFPSGQGADVRFVAGKRGPLPFLRPLAGHRGTGVVARPAASGSSETPPPAPRPRAA